MAEPRVVAELGRPETPQETADRKAASSRAYRSSQTFRNLVAALLVTVAVVAVIIFAVPRGEVPAAAPVDAKVEADAASETFGRDLVVPEVPENWLLNSAKVDNIGVSAWTLIYAPPTGFVRVAQGFTTDEAWPSRLFDGATVAQEITINGIVWDEYRLPSATTERNISYAIATPAGDNIIVIYGTTQAETAAVVAESIADQIRALREAAS